MEGLEYSGGYSSINGGVMPEKLGDISLKGLRLGAFAVFVLGLLWVIVAVSMMFVKSKPWEKHSNKEGLQYLGASTHSILSHREIEPDSLFDQANQTQIEAQQLLEARRRAGLPVSPVQETMASSPEEELLRKITKK